MYWMVTNSKIQDKKTTMKLWLLDIRANACSNWKITVRIPSMIANNDFSCFFNSPIMPSRMSSPSIPNNKPFPSGVKAFNNSFSNKNISDSKCNAPSAISSVLAIFNVFLMSFIIFSPLSNHYIIKK